jgi:NADPH:quinone reductase-like Zn-dependent oxidoreductase
MFGVALDKPGGPEVLYLKKVAKPQLQSSDANFVIVSVRATALNRADTLQRQGNIFIRQ